MIKAIIVGIIMLAASMAAQANTAWDYAMTEGQTLVVTYVGCDGEEVWMMNGTPQNWVAAERGTPPGFPMWVVAVTPEEVTEVLSEWFKEAPIVLAEKTVPQEWCAAGGIELKKNSI